MAQRKFLLILPEVDKRLSFILFYLVESKIEFYYNALDDENDDDDIDDNDDGDCDCDDGDGDHVRAADEGGWRTAGAAFPSPPSESQGLRPG